MYKIQSWIFFLFFLFSLPAFLQANSSNVILPEDKPDSTNVSLSGKVIAGDTKEFLPGAVIYFPDLKRGTTADVNGFYSIKNLPSTKLLVQISYLGYKNVIDKIDLDTIKIKDFVLDPSITEIKELIITGSSLNSEIKKSPFPVSIMERKEIDQVNTTNIINALTLVPGVNAVSTGPNVSKPFIHGMGYNRVLTLIDGIRQEGQQWGDEHGIEVDENSIYKAEIIKGPASLLYGSDALAGVVYLSTYPPAIDGEFKSSLSLFSQSNNKLIGSSFSFDRNKKGLTWGGRLSYKMAGNYQNKIDGRVYGTAFRETDASGYLGVNRSWGFSNLVFSLYNNLQMIPDGSRDSLTRRFTKSITEGDIFRPIVSIPELNSYTIGTLHQHIRHYRVYSLNNLILGDSKLVINIGYQQNIRQEFSHPEAGQIPGLYLILRTFTYDLKYYFPEKNDWVVCIGVNGMIQTNKVKGTDFIIPPYFLFDTGPFLYSKKNIGNINFSGGVRFDSRYFSNKNLFVTEDPTTGFMIPVTSVTNISREHLFSKYNHTYTGWSGSLGLTYQPYQFLTLKSNLSTGYRAPNIFEISAAGVHPGTNIYQIGNMSFKPEVSFQKDFGIYYSKGHFEGSIELFDIWVGNYIFNQKLINSQGQDSIIIPGNQTFKFQQSKAHLYGGEVNTDIHPHPLDWIHFDNSLSWITGVNKGTSRVMVTNSAKYLPYIPPLHWHSEIRTNLAQRSKRFKEMYLRLGLDFYSGQNKVYAFNNTETPTPGYTLYSAGIGSDLADKKGRNFCSIHLSASNLFNIAYQSHLSRLKYFEPFPNNSSGHFGIYDMGRNIGIRIEFKL